MVSNLIIIGSIVLLVLVGLVIYKKPDVLKRDINKPLSLTNFSIKKTFIGDWKGFFIWALLMYLVWSYAHDTQVCRELIQNIDQICLERAALGPDAWFNGAPLDEIKFLGDNNGRLEEWGYNQPSFSGTIPPDS